MMRSLLTLIVAFLVAVLVFFAWSVERNLEDSYEGRGDWF
jgi:hypothetical protein